LETKLARRGLRGVELSRNSHSMPMRFSLVLSCSTMVKTSEVSSSQARWGYLERGERRDKEGGKSRSEETK
jgi:hypothetical protein